MARTTFLRTLRAYSLKQWLVLGALILVLGMGAYYTAKVVRFAVYTRRGGDAPIRGWMSVRYIANTHHVPAAALYDAIGLPADSADRRPLMEIAKAQNRSLDEIRVSIENAIVDYRAAHPPENGGQN